MKVLPNTVTGLIEELDAQYPERCIARNESEVEAQRYAGRRDLIVELKRRQEATERKATKEALIRN